MGDCVTELWQFSNHSLPLYSVVGPVGEQFSTAGVYCSPAITNLTNSVSKSEYFHAALPVGPVCHL